MPKVHFRLYLISGKGLAPLSKSLAGGLPAFLLRRKDISDRRVLALARKARRLTRGHGAKFLVHGRWDIAKIVGADGVHLPEESIPIAVVRRFLGNKALVGKSTHSLASAKRAQREGADFITFGPVFETASKRQYGPPKGLAALRRVCKTVKLPVFALGGIKKKNASAARATGAFGVALISGIWNAGDPRRATRELKGAI